VSEARHRARLQRSLSALTIGAVKARDERERSLAPLESGEFLQQIQLNVNGKAFTGPAVAEVEVAFPHAFLTRLGRETGPENPTFHDGAEVASGGPVMIHTQVIDWIENDSGLLTGARIRIHSWWPGASAELPFAAVVHLTFIGYAAPTTDDSEG
jgi:hypothetical protein